MNYGHALQFGTFITPLNTNPEGVVALAKLSESLAYDLVTFQDHPYQAKFLDTWTLLSWVAGQTEKIQLSANVLNLPLRSPSVLARSAASLDLLSDGRFNLGLGAGAFWDAIVAMGGQHLTPKQAVEALNEAIDILHNLIYVGDDRPFSFKGQYYELNGAQRGPVSRHNIPLWLGAYKPNMLRLTGQKADGWLVSMNYLKAGQLQSANQAIDDAAIEAGRDPREIRRLLNISGQFSSQKQGFLNGSSQAWVDDLLPLILEDGIGTLILMSDDTHSIEQFAHEVIPALREAVNNALPNALSPIPIRPYTIRAKRRSGINYDQVPASLQANVIEPGDVNYARVKSTYMRGGSPAIVFQVSSPEAVVEALTFARQHPHAPLSIRSGGHGISGRSTNQNGIVIDLSKLNKIEVLDPATRLVRIEAGARWMDVALTLAPYGWALSSGDYGGVGVGGLATAGGIGWLVRQHGLTIDHLQAATIVLADGSIVRASATENPDLFWAIRGAGANFGIVTAFEFQVDEVGLVGWGQLVLDASNPAEFLEKWGAIVESSPRDLTSFLIMGPPRRGQPAIANVMTMVNSDEPEVIINRLQPIANISALYDQNVIITHYANIMANAQGGDHDGQGDPVARSGLIKHITPEFAAAAAHLILSGAVHFFQIRSVGGAVSDVDPDATAYAYRDANFSVVAFGASRERVNALWQDLEKHFNGLYLNFETDQHPKRLKDAFPPKTLQRLRELKERYDPDNIFRDNFNIASQPISR